MIMIHDHDYDDVGTLCTDIQKVRYLNTLAPVCIACSGAGVWDQNSTEVHVFHTWPRRGALRRMPGNFVESMSMLRFTSPLLPLLFAVC
jgi:hypothetical protein